MGPCPPSQPAGPADPKLTGGGGGTNEDEMATTIGVARLTIYLEDSFSLKDKRQVVRSITHQVRNKFNVSIAEVSDLDDMRMGTLAVACVSNSAPPASSSASSATSRPS
jgi:uncharacterized protein YlxP (DUF503 family)